MTAKLSRQYLLVGMLTVLTFTSVRHVLRQALVDTFMGVVFVVGFSTVLAVLGFWSIPS